MDPMAQYPREVFTFHLAGGKDQKIHDQKKTYECEPHIKLRFYCPYNKVLLKPRQVHLVTYYHGCLALQGQSTLAPTEILQLRKPKNVMFCPLQNKFTIQSKHRQGEKQEVIVKLYIPIRDTKHLIK